MPKLRLAYISGDGARETVREVIDTLGLVFDHSVCQCLTASVDTLPSYPLALDDNETPTVKVNTATRFLLKRIAAEPSLVGRNRPGWIRAEWSAFVNASTGVLPSDRIWLMTAIR